MPEIDVDPQALDTAHTQVLLSAGRIGGLMEDLAAYLQPMQATWSGSAADAADTVIAAFAGAADGELTTGQLLAAIAQLVGEVDVASRLGEVRELVAEGFLELDRPGI
jgi:uncharacterized protein YukE